jgi:hypothetical protein
MGKPPALSAFLALLCAAFACFNSGCQTTALRVSTTAQAQSVTEFYYQQVLQNTAYLSQHPDGLPFFSAAGQGQTSINDTVSATDMFGFDVLSSAATGFTGLLGHMLLDKQYTTLTGSRLSTQLWTTQTTTAPDRLALMRCAYLSVLGCNDPPCMQTLNAFYGPRYSPCPPLNPSAPDPDFSPDPAYNVLVPGWCFICKRSCVPKWACKVGYCGDTAAWVGPGQGMQALSDFTKVILDIASAADGGHLEAQITALRAKAKDLSEILKNDPLKTVESSRRPLVPTAEPGPTTGSAPKSGSAPKTTPDPSDFGNVGQPATIELQREYLETLVLLERAILHKQLALTTDENVRKRLCARLQGLSKLCPDSPGANADCIHPAPYLQPALQPRLNLNLVPVYVNPPGG